MAGVNYINTAAKQNVPFSHQASLAKPHTWGGSSYSGGPQLLFFSSAFLFCIHLKTEHWNGSLKCTWASCYTREWKHVTFLFLYIHSIRKTWEQQAGKSPLQQVNTVPSCCFWKDLCLEYFFMQDLMSSVYARCVISQVYVKQIHPAPASHKSDCKVHWVSIWGRDNQKTDHWATSVLTMAWYCDHNITHLSQGPQCSVVFFQTWMHTRKTL